MTTPRDRFVEKHGEKAANKIEQPLMSMLAADAAKQIADMLAAEGMADKIGVTVVMFDASTARRDDFLPLLDELRGKLANAVPGTPRGD